MLKGIIEKFYKEQGLDQTGNGALLAVSGGVDSMVLADVYLNSGFPFSIAHVNFGLRIPDSDQDESLVREFAEKHEIPLYVLRPETKKYAKEQKLSIQMAARKLRYDFFEAVMADHNLQFLATAHHANDNLENFFIYLLRNNLDAAVKGIAAIQDRRLKPLLEISKTEIIEYAETNGITWREDSSNSNTDYLRNKVRNLIVPGLLEYYPEALDDYSELSEKFQKYFTKEEENSKIMLDDFTRKEGNRIKISSDILELKNGAKALELFFRNQGFHRNTVRNIITSKQSGSLYIGGKADVFREPDGFAVMEKANNEETPELLIHETDFPIQVFAGKYEILFSIVKPDSHLEFGEFWQFDLDEIHFPIAVCDWKTGDKMELFGSGKHKKISDILIDAKVGNSSKKLFPVLKSGNEVLGLTALKRSNLAKVKANTRQILSIKWHLQSN